MTPADRLYTKDHEWVQVQGDRATIGITQHAQNQLGEIVFIELPTVGTSFKEGDECGTIESVKAVAEIYVPLSGKVVEINEDVVADPENVNDDPYGEGWLFRMQFSDSSRVNSLLSASGYEDYIKEAD